MRIEETIVSNLLFSDEYSRKVIPFLKMEYFSDTVDAAVVSEVVDYLNKYDRPITKEILEIQCANRKDMSDNELSRAIELVASLEDKGTNKVWLVEETEKFCQQRALYNSIIKSISIFEGRDKNLSKESIPKLLQDALAVSFDVSVGHDYFKDAEARYDFYSLDEERIPFDLTLLNKIMKGGMPGKSLIVVAAQSGGGKSLFMTHVAASTLRQGKNVLYITLEMAEERISERIDANLLKVDIDALGTLTKEDFIGRIENIEAKTHGRLFVKEYPPGAAHAGHFRGLIEELKIKQNFVPDLLIVDYLGICASARMKMGGSVNTYQYLKSIAEELRGLGVEYGIPVLTGAQLNRSGFDNSDVELTSMADSMGLVMTADVLFALIRTDELDENQQIMVKQLKNRYNDPSYYKRFVVGLERKRMTFYDVEESAQRDIADSGQVENTAPEPRTRGRGSLDSLNF